MLYARSGFILCDLPAVVHLKYMRYGAIYFKSYIKEKTECDKKIISNLKGATISDSNEHKSIGFVHFGVNLIKIGHK